ncbi:MAG TPA: hypothetical protein DF383_10270 [Deltaproteobacteria bacterium]|nr:hypothetical protein [Deltaproteobacteria bacterium]
MKIFHHFLIGLLCIFTFGAFSLQAATVTSNADSGAGSLRQAILDAVDGEIISIPADTSMGGPIILSGQIQILQSNLTIQGAGAGLTTIDGDQKDRIFEIGDGVTPTLVTITGMTIKNGKTVGESGAGISVNSSSTLQLHDSHVGPNTAEIFIFPGGFQLAPGGGIASSGSLFIFNSTIDGNSATGGGGILCDGPLAELTDTTISNNKSTLVSGGGIFNRCKLTLRGTSLGTGACNVTGNTGNSGGGIFNHSNSFQNPEIYIDTCTISNNTGQAGGGIRNSNSGGNVSTTIFNSIISGNHAITAAPYAASGIGGGIANGDLFDVTSKPLTIDRTTISNNDATGIGGGIANFDSSGSLMITNTTLSENYSDSFGGGGIATNSSADISNTTFYMNETNGDGGGILNFDQSTINLNNVTIANNTADKDGIGGGNGGGIAGHDSATINFQNTLIADNFDTSTSGAVDKDCSTTGGLTLNSQGYNLIGVVDVDCVISGDTTGNITNQPAGLDPSGLQTNGSNAPLTVALLANSLALEAANPATATATDERGVARPQPQGSVPDIGAFELDATLSPAPAPGGGGNSSDGSVSGGGCSLTELPSVFSSGWFQLFPFVCIFFAALRRRTK